MRFLRLAFPLALLLVLAGCDSTDDGGETFPLTSERPVRFTYAVGEIDSGSVFTIDPNDEQSSEEVINDSRFGPADVASATIRSMSVELNMDFPSEATISLDEAVLTLSAPGVSDQVIARGTDFELAIIGTNASLRRAELTVERADITAFLQQETFAGMLTLDVEGADGGSYQFTVSLDVDIEVNA